MNGHLLSQQRESLWGLDSSYPQHSPRGEKEVGSKEKQNNRGLGDKKQIMQWTSWERVVKEWPVRHREAFRPQPRFYCVHSAHPGTQITHVDSEFYKKRFVWSPETQKHLDAWPSKSVTRMAETQRLSRLCGSSPHTNHSLWLHSSTHIVVL